MKMHIKLVNKVWTVNGKTLSEANLEEKEALQKFIDFKERRYRSNKRI